MTEKITREEIQKWSYGCAGKSHGVHINSKVLAALCDLALQALDMEPRPTHRHIKTGGLYQMLGSGAVQSERPLTDMQAVVIYRAMKDGTLWAREFHEFHDAARFEPLTSLPEPRR